MYKTKRWINKRKYILKRDKYLCQGCIRFGKHTPAVMVHHIVPYEHAPELAFENSNLISLCNKCHEKAHIRKTHELSEYGKSFKKQCYKRTSPPDFNRN